MQHTEAAMSDADAIIICEFMEPVVGFRGADYPYSVKGWWWRKAGLEDKHPVPLTLDRLHEVEARLTDAQRHRYLDLLCGSGRSIGTMLDIRQFDYADAWGLAHATAAQKITALAAVLRGKA